MDEQDFAAWRTRVHDEWTPRTLAEATTRRGDIGERVAMLTSYANLTRSQRDELDQLNGEMLFVDEVIGAKSAEVRRTELAEISRAAQDPRNRTAGDGGAAPGAPAIVHGRGDRDERPAEVLQRMGGNPWRGQGGAPLDGESTEGYVARAQTALQGLEGRLTHDGAEKLASLLSLRPDPTAAYYEKRTQEDIRRSAEFVLAACNPFYESAFTHILKDPMAFRSGFGALRWTPDEQAAFTAVEVSRAALFESGTGSVLLPLTLDDTILLTNTGAASPWRQIARTVTTTSNTWEGVSSAGVTAHWYQEGAVTSDDTPTLTQIIITPHMESAFAFASFEQIADSRLGEQIPALMNDAFARLEATAFALGAGDGSNSPWGAITRATVDGSTGLVNVAAAASVLSLITNMPARFRTGDARPYFVANIGIINVLRATTAFAAATEAIVDDSTTPPKIFGIPLLESSDMDSSNAAGGHKNLLLLDGNQFLAADRLGTNILFEPSVKGAGGILPSRQAGWLAYRRVGSDVVTATGLRVHNNA